ncbi:MAG: electron transport complex subunit RsxC [Treponema sp.]|nr:electron transport complex subunit RsxC [Treponema sp.]
MEQALKTFKRGLKLDPRKNVTEGGNYEIINAPEQVAIPVNQHFGAPNKPIVNQGDRVKRGQKIAEGATPGPMTVPVHASVSGTVKSIEPRLLQNNTEGFCIVIETDSGQDETDFMPALDPFSCTKEEALIRIRDAGIIGMGGAGFPAHIKFNPPAEKIIDTIIANGAECEPYLTADEALMYKHPEAVIQGLSIAMKITGVKKAIIGLEDNKAKLIPVLQKELDRIGGHGEITFALCRSMYPQGGEKLLIKALTGREVPSGGLPMDAGCIVSNVATLAAIAESFTLGKPLIERIMTVSGGACGKPKNLRVPVGTVISGLPPELLEINYQALRKIVFGGPMMGNALTSVSVPVQKNTSGIILFTGEEINAEEEGTCIRCTRCVRNCPCRLSPVAMNTALNTGDFDGAISAGLLDCIECGTCSYVCPGRIKLTQRFRTGKQRLRFKQQLSAENARIEAEKKKRTAELFKNNESAVQH